MINQITYTVFNTGVQRETKEELDFGDFNLFEDANQPYASTNFVYEPLQYERLVKLFEYNTLLKLDDIKAEMIKSIERKRLHREKDAALLTIKMQRVLEASKRFKNKNGLKLKVDEEGGKRFVNLWKKRSVKYCQSSSLEEDDIYEDAIEEI